MNEQDIFEVRQTDVEIQEIFDQVPKNKKAIEDINGKLPAEASPENPLADKEYVDGKVGGEADARQEAVNAEKTRAEGAEQTLQQGISTEAQTRQQADQTLDGKIAANTQAIADEKTRAQQAEQQEAQARQQDISALAAQITQTLTDYYLKTETMSATEIQTLVSDTIAAYYTKLQVDALIQDFITKSVNDLTNYYLKTETFTKAEVQQLVDNVRKFQYKVVATLPQPTADTVGWIYLMPGSHIETQNVKEEYITILEGSSYKWEHIGSTNVDLSGYSTTEEMNAAIASALASYYTKAQVDEMVQTINTAISQKQDTIDDLATIRSGAAAGATALQPAALSPYSTTEQMNAAIKTESDRAKDAEQALQTGKQAVILDLATIAMGSGVSHDDTYSSIRAAAIADFILLTNAMVDILFTTPINAADATLNVSATGAKPLRILGQSLPAGVVKAQTYATLVYDGTAWNIVNLFCPDAQFDPAALVVDMGLSSGVKWAARDIDLTKPGGFCETPFTYEKSFLSWGNIDGHNPISVSAFDYNWGNVNQAEPWYEGQPYGDTPGNTLTGNIAVGEDFDAARANLGAPWRMPTNSEYGELFANIIYIDANGDEVDTTKADKRVSVNGILGLYLESKINGARLFFSCSGYGNGRSWFNRGSNGLYWASTFDSARRAKNMNFNSGGVKPQDNGNRYFGFALRPVQ